MSISEAGDPRFPHRRSGLPPSPTIENPGGVYPHFDPEKATPAQSPARNGTPQFIGNPYMMNEAFRKLDRSLGDIIAVLETEERSGGAEGENELLEKFRDWRDDLDRIRTGRATNAPARTPAKVTPDREGGLFLD